MKFRRLGHSGLQVSVIGLGGNNFGFRCDERQSARIIAQAIDLGINFIDTADIYGETRSEEFIGSALDGKRAHVVIATKFGAHASDMSAILTGQRPPPEEVVNRRGGSRKHLMRAAEESLRRLRTDYIDLYQLHFPDRETPIEETLRALDDLVHQGKVRYVGCSNFTAWRVCEAVWTSRLLNLASFVSVQPYYNLLRRDDVENDLTPFCESYGISIIPYFPLESGLLSGKYRPGTPPPADGRLAAPVDFYRSFLTQENLERVERLATYAGERGHTVAELALGWLLAQPAVCSVIPGATSPEQVVANAKAAQWELDSAELGAVDELVPPRRQHSLV